MTISLSLSLSLLISLLSAARSAGREGNDRNVLSHAQGVEQQFQGRLRDVPAPMPGFLYLVPPPKKKFYKIFETDVSLILRPGLPEDGSPQLRVRYNSSTTLTGTRSHLL
jgi:hypothetical protein